MISYLKGSTTTLLKQKSNYFEAERSNEMETEQVPGVDPEKHASQNLNESSLAGREIEDCLDGGKSQRHVAEVCRYLLFYSPSKYYFTFFNKFISVGSHCKAITSVGIRPL